MYGVERRVVSECMSRSNPSHFSRTLKKFHAARSSHNVSISVLDNGDGVVVLCVLCYIVLCYFCVMLCCIVLCCVMLLSCWSC